MNSLFSIASLIGIPLKIDSATQSLSRPSVARVCIEVDISKPQPMRVWIGTDSSGFWQTVEYENLPEYCTKCRKLGHGKLACNQGKVQLAQQQEVWKPMDTSVLIPPSSSGLTAQQEKDFPNIAGIVTQQPTKQPDEVQKLDDSHVDQLEKNDIPIQDSCQPLQEKEPQIAQERNQQPSSSCLRLKEKESDIIDVPPASTIVKLQETTQVQQQMQVGKISSAAKSAEDKESSSPMLHSERKKSVRRYRILSDEELIARMPDTPW